MKKAESGWPLRSLETKKNDIAHICTRTSACQQESTLFLPCTDTALSHSGDFVLTHQPTAYLGCPLKESLRLRWTTTVNLFGFGFGLPRESLHILDETERRQRAAFGYTHALREASRGVKEISFVRRYAYTVGLLLRTYLGSISTGRQIPSSTNRQAFEFGVLPCWMNPV